MTTSTRTEGRRPAAKRPAKETAAARSAKAPEPKSAIECGYVDCSVRFVPKRSTAKYCSATCRQRARRAAAAANAEQRVPVDPGTGDAEHGLVRAVRQDLERADAIGTVAGQLALQLARRAANPEESGLSLLSKEIRALIAEAKGVQAEPDAPPAEPDDEVTKARKARAEAREAAGRA